MLARSRVPLIPPVVSEPVAGLRIRRGGEVTFAGQGEPGADLVLYRVQGEERTPLAVGVVDARGNWVLSDVKFPERGAYSLIVEETTDSDVVTSSLHNIEYRPLPPIVFVPGFFACTNGVLNTDMVWRTSEFPSQLGTINHNSLLDPTATGILPLVDQLIYGPLLTYFDSQGYVLNETFFVACYNWSGSMEEEAEQVGRMFDYASDHNTSGLSLTVLTHSNGGLVTRYYIQAYPEHTRSQIHSVIMIAPPNQGVPRAYYPWEGGDISQESGEINVLLRLAFAFHNDPRCLLMPGLYELEPAAYQQAVYDCLHRGEPWARLEDMPSISWLVPDGEFLKPRDGLEQAYPNSPIRSINTPESYDLFFDGIQERLVILSGVNIGTTKVIEIDPPEPGARLWKAGKPRETKAEEMPADSGDGSVLETSTRLRNFPENDRYQVEIFPNAGHTEGIIKREDVFAYIARILNEDFPPPPLPPTSGESESLIIWVESPVGLLVTDSQGRRIGIDEHNNFLADIPGAAYGELSGLLGPKIIMIPQATTGEYRFQVRGLAEGDYKLYGLSSGQARPLIAQSGHITLSEVKNYTEKYVPIQKRGRWQIWLYSGLGLVILSGVSLALIITSKYKTAKRQSVKPKFSQPPRRR